MSYKHLFWFCFLQYILWCLLAIPYFLVSGFYLSWIGILFTVLFIPGARFLFAAGLGLPLVLLRWLFPKTAYTGALILGTLLNIALFADFLVYTQYRFHISLAMLQLFFGPAGREIFTFPTSMYFLLCLGLIAITFLTWGLLKLARCISWGGKTIGVVCTVCLLLFTGYNGMYIWGKFMNVPAVLVQMPHLPWTVPMSMNRRLRKMGFEPKSQPYEMPRSGSLYYPQHEITCSAEAKPNILFILIDSWRADAFTPQIMPHTYTAYIKQPHGFYFTNHLSGGNATDAGVFSLFYAIPYTYRDSVTNSKMRPVFMQKLEDLGYTFGIFSSSKLNSPAFNRNVFLGIQPLRISSQGEEKWQRDEDAQKDFLQFLDQHDPKKPFFGFLFYDSAHGSNFPADYPAPFTPYAPEINYLLLTKNTDPEPYINRYRNSVHYIDSLLKNTFDELKKYGLDKNTIIILTGDHGQELNDTGNNFWGHNSNFADYQTHVPLLVWWPGKKGGEKNYRTAHYDIIPALLQEALHCTNTAKDYSAGQNLFDSTPRPWTLIGSYTNKAIREGDIISVLNNYGTLTSYDGQLRPAQTISPQALADSFKETDRFYKPAPKTENSSK